MKQEHKEEDTRRVHSTSNDIWLRDMGAEQRYDGKACDRTAQDGTHNARHYPSRSKSKNLDPTRNKRKRYHQHYQESKA